MTKDEIVALQIKLAQVFRPGAPIDSRTLFSGRTEEVNRVLSAIFQPGQHVILYGERGVGKTSLAKTLVDILRHVGVTALSSGTINCDGTDDFSALWHKVFRELQVVVRLEKKAGFAANHQDQAINLDKLLPAKITPDDVRVAIMQAIEIAADKKKMIVILDEVDRIADKQVTTLLADTLKNLSDHLVPVTIIFIGVADAVDQLIQEHASVERSLIQVPMPRMSPGELAQVIDKGLGHANMTIEPKAKTQIVELSQGLPHFTHLLGLESASFALGMDRTHVTEEDVTSATKASVSKSHSLISAYHKATNSPQKNSLFEEVLLACALSNKDELGWFSGSDVAKPLTGLMGKEYTLPYFARHLNEFASEKRGKIIQKYDAKRQHKYRFTNPLMGPFTIIHALSCGWFKELIMARAAMMPGPPAPAGNEG
jgi:Cdc6-like AAA superfamily ATPase